MKNMTCYILITLSLIAGSAHGITIINNSDSDKVFKLISVIPNEMFYKHADITTKIVPAHGKASAKIGNSRFTIHAYVVDSDKVVVIDCGRHLNFDLKKALSQQLTSHDKHGKKKAIPEDSFLIFHDEPDKKYISILEPEFIAQLRSLPHMQQLFNDIDNNKSPLHGLSMLSIVGKEQGGVVFINLINDTNNTVNVDSIVFDTFGYDKRKISPRKSWRFDVYEHFPQFDFGIDRIKSTQIRSLELKTGCNTHTYFINYQPLIYYDEDYYTHHSRPRTEQTVYVSSFLQ